MATQRENITRLFTNVGIDYIEAGIATFELHDGHDVHAFYRLIKEPGKVIHVQGYPGMSVGEKARVWARLMDYGRMAEIRASGGVSIGNEHEATVQNFPNFAIGVEIPYSSKKLKELLAENVPELR
ncbi:MAG: hypothetical protein HY367_03790 [Candidatus Aenigmarchaeota archaeon]|nr:hypothetical protein [Candidatus Aenigmarchaeota archaeon]